MPRGKKSKVKKLSRNEFSIGSDTTESKNSTWLEDFKMQLRSNLDAFDALYNEKMTVLINSHNLAHLKIPAKIGNEKLIVKAKELHTDKVKKMKNMENINFEANGKRQTRQRIRSSSVCSNEVETGHEILQRRVTRSSSLSSINRTFKKLVPSASRPFKTPATRGMAVPLSMITPKVVPNAPLSVLRHPQQGELAVSLSGSPLLVTSLVHDQRANVNVPLADGRVLSILPEPGFRPYDVPHLDEDTLEQLQTLREHISAFINMKQK